MRFLLSALLVVVVVGSACGPRQAQLVASPPPPSPSQLAVASPSPSESAAPSSPSPSPQAHYTPGPWSWPTPQPAAGTRMLVITSADVSGSPTTVTMITIDGGKTTTRQVLSMPDLYVMDARGDLALVLVDQATKLALLNLQTGQIKLLPVYSAGDLGGGRFSPDGSQAVIGVRDADLSGHRLDIVTIRTGAVRTLVTIPSSAYHGAGLDVLRWVTSGILVTPGVWDGLPSQVYRLDPSTAALTLLTQSRVQVTSAGGAYLAAPNHLNLGDGQFQGQGSWPNQLVEGPIGGNQTVVAQQKNRAFGAADIADDGSLLYSVDGAPLASGAPTSDMGLYLARGGRSMKLLSESWISQWTAATFVGAQQALVIQTRPTAPGTLEIDLIDLASPTPVPVLRVIDSYPVGYVVALD